MVRGRVYMLQYILLTFLLVIVVGRRRYDVTGSDRTWFNYNDCRTVLMSPAGAVPSVSMSASNARRLTSSLAEPFLADTRNRWKSAFEVWSRRFES
jgi:hypothetical protein